MLFIANRIEKPPNPAIQDMARIFAVRDIQRSSCHFFITGPNFGCDKSHWYHLSEDFAKQAAATSNKGVVGNKGRKMPKAAKPTNKKPRDLYISIIVE